LCIGWEIYLSGLLPPKLSSGDEPLTYKKNPYFWDSLMKYTCYAWLLSFYHSGIQIDFIEKFRL